MSDTVPDIEETCLYRHFDKGRCLLYVGISLNALSRLSKHRNVSGWFGRIHYVEIERFPTRQDAMLAERNAILSENPIHNIARPKSPSAPSDRKAQSRARARANAANQVPFVDRVSATVGDTCQATGLGKTTVYELINAGTIETCAVGTRRLVLVRSVVQLIDPTHNSTHKSAVVSSELKRTTAEKGTARLTNVQANNYGPRRLKSNG